MDNSWAKYINQAGRYESVTRFLRIIRPVQKAGECWMWPGSIHQSGYGQFFLSFSTKRVRVHRFAYEIFVGPIPDGLYCLHRCDNKACVNPDHLYLGTHQDNMNDRNQRGRTAHSERHGRAKLTASKVLAIRKAATQGKTRRQLADKYHVSPECIRDIANHRRWKYTGGPVSQI